MPVSNLHRYIISIKTPHVIYIFVFLFSDRVGADITVLREREVDYDSDVSHKIAEVLIRKVPDDQQVSRRLVFWLLFCW